MFTIERALNGKNFAVVFRDMEDKKFALWQDTDTGLLVLEPTLVRESTLTGDGETWKGIALVIHLFQRDGSLQALIQPAGIRPYQTEAELVPLLGTAIRYQETGALQLVTSVNPPRSIKPNGWIVAGGGQGMTPQRLLDKYQHVDGRRCGLLSQPKTEFTVADLQAILDSPAPTTADTAAESIDLESAA